MAKTHGTRYCYISGCKCEECRKANSTYIAKYRHKRAKLASQYSPRTRRAWAPWEDELTSDYTKTTQQLALILGRTASAVTNRRRILLARRKNQH